MSSSWELLTQTNKSTKKNDNADGLLCSLYKGLFLHSAGQRSACYKSEYNDRHSCCCGCHRCVCEWVSVQERECMWKRKPNIARRFSLEPSQVHVCLFHVTNRNKFTTNSHKNKPKLKCQQQTHSSNSPFSKTYKLQKYEKSKETAHSHWESGKKKRKFVLYIYVPTISKGHQFLMKNCYALVLLCKCSTWPGLCEISHMQSWTEIDDAVMTLLTKASVRLE